MVIYKTDLPLNNVIGTFSCIICSVPICASVKVEYDSLLLAFSESIVMNTCAHCC